MSDSLPNGGDESESGLGHGPCPDYSDECGFVYKGRCAVCDYGRDD